MGHSLDGPPPASRVQDCRAGRNQHNGGKNVRLRRSLEPAVFSRVVSGLRSCSAGRRAALRSDVLPAPGSPTRQTQSRLSSNVINSDVSCPRPLNTARIPASNGRTPGYGQSSSWRSLSRTVEFVERGRRRLRPRGTARSPSIEHRLSGGALPQRVRASSGGAAACQERRRGRRMSASPLRT